MKPTYYDKPREPNKDRRAHRANPPGRYVCPECGETLSGPASLYACPKPQRKAA